MYFCISYWTWGIFQPAMLVYQRSNLIFPKHLLFWWGFSVMVVKRGAWWCQPIKNSHCGNFLVWYWHLLPKGIVTWHLERQIGGFLINHKKITSLKLTWTLKIGHPKRKVVFHTLNISGVNAVLVSVSGYDKRIVYCLFFSDKNATQLGNKGFLQRNFAGLFFGFSHKKSPLWAHAGTCHCTQHRLVLNGERVTEDSLNVLFVFLYFTWGWSWTPRSFFLVFFPINELFLCHTKTMRFSICIIQIPSHVMRILMLLKQLWGFHERGACRPGAQAAGGQLSQGAWEVTMGTNR